MVLFAMHDLLGQLIGPSDLEFYSGWLGLADLTRSFTVLLYFYYIYRYLVRSAVKMSKG